MAVQKITIIFPPGDILTSVLWEKEKDTKIVDLLKRLTVLRGINLETLKIYNDLGKKLEGNSLEQSFEQAGIVFLELVDKSVKKQERLDLAPKETADDDEDFDSKAITGIPKAIKDKVVVGSFVDIPLRDQLFDPEWELLQKFKSNNAELCSNYSDEFVMACLFSRRLNPDRALQLLQNNLKWRKEKGLMNIPKLSEIPIEGLAPFFSCPGSRSKAGNNISYMLMSKMIPGQEPFTIPTMCKIMAWYNFVGILYDGMDGHRHGVYLVGDMSSIGWKNFDVDYNKAFSNLWQDVFPGRPKKILVVNPPLIFSAIFKVMSTFMKKKIADRFQVVDVKDVPKYIEKNNLISSFGGSLDWDHDKFNACLRAWADKHEERLIAPGRQKN